VFYRVDERAVHGQTVVAWSKVYPVDGIILVSDHIAGDTLLRKIYSNAAFGTPVHVFDEKTAARKLVEAENSAKKYMVIAQDVSTFSNLIEAGSITPEKINIGPMAKKDDRKSVTMGIYLNEAEMSICKKINDLNIDIEFQLLPESDAKKFKNLRV